MLLLIVLGIGLSLPLAVARSGAPPGGGLLRDAPAAPALSKGQLAAVVRAAQLPMDAVNLGPYLPLVASGEGVAPYNMPMQTTLPWSAVGFLDNGCTGVLIDSQHVLAAAHCYVYDFATAAGDPHQQGDWQTGLTYFPNYNPARSNPPRYAVDRMVVGTRSRQAANIWSRTGALGTWRRR